MTKKFLIAGSIVDTDAERETYEDVTPAQVNAFLNKLEPNDDVELDITSYGGSVSAGIAICNLLKQASANGHKTKSHVIGIAASMASAIACACDEMTIDANSFWMCHLPWTMSVGNAIDLRKEAEVLDTYRDALVSIYKTKFDASNETIIQMMESETWILGDAASFFGLKAEVIPTVEPLRIAASLKMPKFMKTPKALKEMIMEKEEEMKQAGEAAETVAEVKAEETPAETVVEEPAEERPKAEDIDQAEPDMVPKAECEKRVSGMQSAMAKQMDALKKDYEARIADFEVQMKAKDEELTKAKAEVTSLGERLDKTAKELSEMTSALVEKTNALDALNAGVNTPGATDAKPWAKLHGEELLKWCREQQARKR